jgi:hypothetical protein
MYSIRSASSCWSATVPYVTVVLSRIKRQQVHAAPLARPVAAELLMIRTSPISQSASLPWP